MAENIRQVVSALRKSHGRLAAVVDGFGHRDLRIRSYCEDWSVAEVLSHIGSSAEILWQIMEAARGDRPPLERERFEEIWERWSAMSPEEQESSALASDHQLVSTLEDIGGELDFLVPNLSGRELDTPGLLHTRLAEVALHTWDIAVAFDPSARIPADTVSLMIDRMTVVAGFLGHGATNGKDRFGVAVRTTEPDRTLVIAVADSVDITSVEGFPEAAKAALRIPGDAFVRLAYGRLREVGGQAGATGVINRLQALFPGE